MPPPIVEGRRHGIEADVFGIGRFGEEVVSAREQEPSHARGAVLGIRLQRKVERCAASLLDGAGVGDVDVLVAAAGLPATALIEARRDPDERPHGAEYTLRPCAEVARQGRAVW